jgi:membrane protein
MTVNVRQRLHQLLWETEPANETQRQLVRIGRFLVVLFRDFTKGQLSMRATSLVYTTLLSLVPVLALGFSVAKALGMHNALEPMLADVFRPLGPQGEELTRNIIGFVENIKVGVLGSLGVALLFYTVVTTLQKIEDSFNHVWRIDNPRALGQRFGEYLTVVMVGPVLVFSALGITATVMSSGFVTKLATVQPFGAVIYVLGKLVPYAMVVGAFTFLYAFIPNTRVRLVPALAGGTIAGVLWQAGSVAFATFVAQSPSYNAVYSGFAIVMLLLAWLYLGWLILLTGCQVAYYVQYPERLTETRIAPHLSGRMAEALGLQVVSVVGRRFIDGQPPPTQEELRRTLPGIPEHVDRVVEILLHQGVLAVSGPSGDQLLPARDFDSMPLGELWQKVRRGLDGAIRTRDVVPKDVHELLDHAEAAFAKDAGRKSVKEWLQKKG